MYKIIALTKKDIITSYSTTKEDALKLYQEKSLLIDSKELLSVMLFYIPEISKEVILLKHKHC